MQAEGSGALGHSGRMRAQLYGHSTAPDLAVLIVIDYRSRRPKYKPWHFTAVVALIRSPDNDLALLASDTFHQQLNIVRVTVLVSDDFLDLIE
ncbi:hypothetical protein AWC16_10810 [Mycolicibacter longobardus]|uniref:Uncharacterized protein n=1 Tax=Mycolicibacter longobardus TaxID=1108812 RepID=A0A1X1YKE9_9MYCO|nr:hypothetical protein AWC16_10810 [Mycolicibacter longobardus]